ncbi:MAG TPA: ATP-binding protein, partial [Myxococcaceae bacterium]|nr:ATP-binding protein [Myxococcaceae bacterium]
EGFLAEATRLLVETLDWEGALQAVARLATRELAEGCIVDVLGDEGGLHRLAVAAREPAQEERLRELMRFAPPELGGPTPLARVLAEGRPKQLEVNPEMLEAHARTAEHLAALRAVGPRVNLVVPLSLGERLLGAIHFLLFTPGRRYTEREQGYAAELARRAAFVVEHARLYRETQQALRARDASLALLEAFIAAAPVGMAFLDRELRYVHINPVLAAINDKPLEAHLGRTVSEVLPGQEATHVEGLLRGVMERGQPLLDRESRVPPRPGIPSRPVRASFFPVRQGEETLGVGAVIQDVTEQKRAEEGLRFLAEASARLTASLELRTTLESTARLVVERMADYCLVDVLAEDEQRLERLAAVGREPKLQALLGAAFRFAPPPGSSSPLWKVWETRQSALYREMAEETLERFTLDAEHRALMKRLGPRSSIMVPLVARGRTLGVLTAASTHPQRRYDEKDLAFLEDLAWRAALAVDNARLYDRAERAVAARDEFVAIATHELRTPLSALGLQLLALKRAEEANPPPSPERLRQGLETALRQTKRLEELLGHLLDVSRLSTGRLELEREPVDLSSLVHRLVERLAEKLAEAGNTPQVHAEALVVVRADRLRVEQVLMNLLTNVMKYAPGAPVELSVAREGAEAVVAVRDQGPGIAPEAQSRIFERFQRASGTHGRDSLGLGLYVSRQIARAHGGELTVESTPGQGARFVLSLPVG